MFVRYSNFDQTIIKFVQLFCLRSRLYNAFLEYPHEHFEFFHESEFLLIVDDHTAIVKISITQMNPVSPHSLKHDVLLVLKLAKHHGHK